MGLCLEADDKRRQRCGRQRVIGIVEASTKEGVEAVESDAFTSPGSPLARSAHCRRISSGHE